MNFYTLIFKKKFHPKKTIKLFFICFFILANSMAFINYYIDPYWMFTHSNFLNNKQADFDERQQKTNYLVFNNNDYDSLILGSSRTTYINQDLFTKSRTFNYAANGMYPYEYEYFIDIFSNIIKKEPEYIILGLDFFGTNQNNNSKFQKQNYYMKSKNDLYRLKMLYNLKIYKYSIKNIKQNLKIKKPFYDRTLNKNHLSIKKEVIGKKIRKGLKTIDNYEYDYRLNKYYKNLKLKYKHSKFIIYITPVSYEQILKFHEIGYDKYYTKWIKELVYIFDGVYNFMIPSNLTKENSNFFDANHATKITVNHISMVLSNDKRISTRNYKYLTQENIDDFIKNYKNLFEEGSINNDK